MSYPHSHPPTTNLAPNPLANSYDVAVTARARLCTLRSQEAAAATALILWLPCYQARAAAITAQASALGLGDIATVSERLATVTTAFSALQEEAHIMQGEYSALQQTIHALETTITAHNSALPAVRAFPEILCAIFRGTSRRPRSVHGHSVPMAPWWLTHICQRWRAVARRYGYLWSHIQIVLPRLRKSSRDLLSRLALEVDSAKSTRVDLSRQVDNFFGTVPKLSRACKNTKGKIKIFVHHNNVTGCHAHVMVTPMSQFLIMLPIVFLGRTTRSTRELTQVDLSDFESPNPTRLDSAQVGDFKSTSLAQVGSRGNTTSR
ncbi:hypothetical protein B0H19DRAFT_1334366 [Mycena capillaripes]|nr:hypothetical protein B0H19DRAFT_1334366 [Mycena capillaripes]